MKIFFSVGAYAAVPPNFESDRSSKVGFSEAIGAFSKGR